MDITCRLCKNQSTKEDSIHLWSNCEAQARKIARKKAIAQCRLKVKKAPSAEARARLANQLINFENFIWSHDELYSFLQNHSIVSLMEDFEEEQNVIR